MPLSAADRQRRSRAHKRGDHALCDPERCPAVTEAVTEVAEPVVTEPVTYDPVLSQLGGRGRRLYREVSEEHPDLGSRQRVLLEEAARTADRLQRLDQLLRGDRDTFASIIFDSNGRRELVVDKTLAEARAQQATLARLLSELRQMLAPADAKPTAPSVPSAASASGGKGGKLVDIRARIAAARSTASG